MVLAAAATVTAGVKLVSSDFFNIKILKADTKVEKVTRGVVDSLEQLPQYNSDTKKIDTEKMSKPYGTADRPFVVLEVVPREELAQFGYHISGCEPINLGNWNMKTIDGGNILCNLNSKFGKAEQRTPAYFFCDEKEGKPEYYGDLNVTKITDANTWGWDHIGFYEYVGEGKGSFDRVESESTTGDISYEMVKNDKGSYIWHTVNQFEKDKYTDAGEYNDNLNKTISEIGDRIYTKRYPSEEEPAIITWNYYTFESYDYFLKKSLSVPENKVKDYPIVIKTITPEKLNQSVKNKDDKKSNASWIDFADLIYFHTNSNADEKLIKAWCIEHDKAYDSSVGKITSFFGKSENGSTGDISWHAAYDIYMKATAKENHTGIVLDSYCYDIGCVINDDNNDKIVDADKLDINIYDFNLDKVCTLNGIGGKASNNNIYKLAVMLYAMDYDRFKKLYMNPDSAKGAIITRDCNGKNKLQPEKANEYWSYATFLLADYKYKVKDNNTNTYTYYDSKDNKIDAGYWNSRVQEYWEKYGTAYNFTQETFATYAYERLVTFKHDNGMVGNFSNNTHGDAKFHYPEQKPVFTEFEDRCKEFEKNGEITEGDRSTAIALKYILGNHSPGESEEQELELNILDIEPCADLEACGTDNKKLRNKWVDKENYLYMMLPKEVLGDIKKINFTHQTTATFNGKIEDLNTKYDMVYIGVDTGAYRTKEMETYVKKNDGSYTKANKILPDWNDDNMDGLVYFHTGDSMKTKDSSTTNIDYIAFGKNLDEVFNSNTDVIKYKNNNSVKTAFKNETRFPGNDITNRKIKELQSFIDSGKPIIVEKDIYECNSYIVDKATNIFSFVKKRKEKEKDKKDSEKRLWRVGETLQKKGVADIFRTQKVTFTLSPNIYNGETTTNENEIVSIKAPNYIPRQANGTAVMQFGFIAPSNEYKYKLIFDQNRDGNLTEDEAVTSGYAHSGENIIKYKLGSSFSGLVQWKLLVYKGDEEKDNALHYVNTGCSVVELLDKKNKKKVKVLQIIPNNDPNNNGITQEVYSPPSGALDLKLSDLFKKYYQNLQDFDVRMDVITLKTYLNCFKADNRFDFDLSKPVNDTDNPKNIDYVNKEFHDKLGSDFLDNITDYNMLIFGFGDRYNWKEISNDNGAVDFIEYTRACGKSILFTHDLTVYYDTTYEKDKYGITTNKLLRDTMGMNPFKMIRSNNTSEYKKRLRDYQNQNIYDSIKLPAAGGKYEDTYTSEFKSALKNGALSHGFTLFSLRKLGEEKQQDDNNFMYKYTTQDLPNGKKLNGDGTSGYYHDNPYTTKAKRLNEGQITQYPYKIDENLKIATTHAQNYLLNLEDKDITVWYTLTSDGSSKDSEFNIISPDDAANNYYIYSKGNVFYSGVGHITVNGDMEAKLFVNTMIAAYRASYEPPVVEVTNEEVTYLEDKYYEIDIPQEYDTLDASTEEKNLQKAEELNDDDGGYLVRFTPIDMNGVSSELHTSLYITNEERIKEEEETEKIVKKYISPEDIYIIREVEDDNGDIVEKIEKAQGLESYTDTNGKVWIKGLQNQQNYAIRYPRKYLSGSDEKDEAGNVIALPRVKFDIKSNINPASSSTTLEMASMPLFELD